MIKDFVGYILGVFNEVFWIRNYEYVKHEEFEGYLLKLRN